MFYTRHQTCFGHLVLMLLIADSRNPIFIQKFAEVILINKYIKLVIVCQPHGNTFYIPSRLFSMVNRLYWHVYHDVLLKQLFRF